MSAVLEENSFYHNTHAPAPVVVVGTGPVGIRFVVELLTRDPHSRVVIYGNEPWEPYNRVRLSGLLTGELDLSSIHNPLKLNTHHNVLQHHNCEIVAIDRENKQVIDRHGNVQPYSQLILATGSTPHIPNIEGIRKPGVFTFRNLNDAQKLIARSTRSRRTVVLGGGLLGLETARGLNKHNTEVIVIDHARHLMAQQLDDRAGSMLRDHMLSQNIQVVLGDSVKCVLGDDRVTGIELRSNHKIECDTIVLAAGIKPNLDLARVASIAIGRGIRVNDQMQTSDADVFAIGECAEHRGRIYGLVAPGLEQARVAALKITGGKSQYTGAQSITRLKVAGVSVFSVGPTSERDAYSHLNSLIWRSADNNYYRKLLFQRNRLIGAIAYGDWTENNRLQDLVQRTRYVWPWQRKRFLREGNLWSAQDDANVSEWPANAIVCQCANVSRGTLSMAVQAGHGSVKSLCTQTGASSICGSCKPLLADLLGSKTIEPEKGNRTLVWTGVVSLLLAFTMLFAPAIPFADSVQVKLQWDQLLRDSLLKQISGFSLLGLGVLISLISLRKRVSHIRLGDFSYWRVIHVVLGTFIALTLVAHTGLRLGFNLNLYLMLSFVSLMLVGAIASGVIGLQHVLPRRVSKQTREMSLWSHILLLWPLPALLSFHVLKSYWF